MNLKNSKKRFNLFINLRLITTTKNKLLKHEIFQVNQIIK